MADPFDTFSSSLDAPASRHFTITAANSDLDTRPRSLYCNTSGVVVVRDGGGIDVTYNVTAGQILPIRAVQVRIGTTATVIGLY